MVKQKDMTLEYFCLLIIDKKQAFLEKRWTGIHQKIHHRDNNNNNNSRKKTPSPTVKKKSAATTTKSVTGLRVGITEEEKKRVQEIFSKMDKDSFWVLEATKAAAAAAAGETYNIPSVEEKILHFALNCNFRQ